MQSQEEWNQRREMEVSRGQVTREEKGEHWRWKGLSTEQVEKEKKKRSLREGYSKRRKMNSKYVKIFTITKSLGN